MIPRIQKVEPQDLCDGMHIMGYELLIYFGSGILVVFIIAVLFLLWVVYKHGGGNTIETIPPERPKKRTE